MDNIESDFVESISSEMFSDGEDILQQLSNDLGLPEFMDDVMSAASSNSSTDPTTLNSISEDPPPPPTLPNGFDLHDKMDQDSLAFFSEIIRQDAMLSPNSLNLKSEPRSPASSQMDSNTGQPPSPTNSDSADSGFGCSVATTLSSPPVSPPRNQTTTATATVAPPAADLGITIPTVTSDVLLNGTIPTVVPATTGGPVPEQLQQQQPFVIFSCDNKQQQPTGGVSEVLNLSDLSNFKIQMPKIVKQPPPTVNKVTPSLVLTTEQLMWLTKSGILRTSHHQVAAPPPATNNQKPIQKPPPPIVIKSEPSVDIIKTTTSDRIDIKAMKRQQRMIKNRESACLSRRKKKEYVANLEENLNNIMHENVQLKSENEALRSRIRELEAEKSLQTTKTTITDSILTSSNVKKGSSIALFAVLFIIVSVNLTSMGGKYLGSEKPLFVEKMMKSPLVENDDLVGHRGRTLLWAGDEESVKNISSICPMYFNQSESLRLDTQLRGWFKLEEENLRSYNRTMERGLMLLRKQRKYLQKKYGIAEIPSVPSHYLKPRTHLNRPLITERKLNENNPQPNDIRLYDSPRFSYESFFKEIERRDDTFYVVSFSGDHLLLPAPSRNQSSRPRMSLLLPAVPRNDSMKPPKHHVAMMQIDCEVINTKLIHIKEDSIPTHMRNASSSDSLRQENQQKSSADSTKNKEESETKFVISSQTPSISYKKYKSAYKRSKRSHS